MNQDAWLNDRINRFHECEIESGSDLFLLEAIVQKDEPAFTQLYLRYCISIFNYLLRIVRDKDAAEDLLQEVYLAVWNGAKNFRKEASVKTWMYQIAHNQAVSWLRKNRQSVEVGEQIVGMLKSDTEQLLIDSWDRQQVSLALNQLSPNHRAVIELAFYHELSYSEIAAVIGCPLGTVKSRMSYAKRYLDKIMKQLGSHD